MAQFKSLPISSIHVAVRTRPVDEEHAQAIAGSMAERGLINPITVRSTPATNGGSTPYTLVAGGHRLRAAEINQWEKIDVIIVAADASEAQMMEISENLFRNELSALDRAIFVMKYREMWEEQNGKIGRGGNTFVTDTKQSKVNDWPLLKSPGKELSERVQARLGFGKTTYKYVTKIGQKLYPPLRQAVRGTDIENDQKMLIKLASMPETKQAGIAAALKIEPDLKKILDMDKPIRPQIDPKTHALDALKRSWKNAPREVRSQFLTEIGAILPQIAD